MTNQHISNARQLQCEYDYLILQVLALTGITNAMYQNFVINTAKEWLYTMFTSIDHDAIIADPLFIQWWKYNWYVRDENDFLSCVYKTEENKLWMYRALHQAMFNIELPLTTYLMEDFKNILPSLKTTL